MNNKFYKYFVLVAFLFVKTLDGIAAFSYEKSYVEPSKNCEVANVAGFSFKRIFTTRRVETRLVSVSDSCESLVGQNDYSLGKIASAVETKSEKEYVSPKAKKTVETPEFRVCVDEQKKQIEELAAFIKKESKVSDEEWKKIEEAIKIEVYIASTKKEELSSIHRVKDSLVVEISESKGRCSLVPREQIKEKLLNMMYSKGLLVINKEGIANFIAVLDFLSKGGSVLRSSPAPYSGYYLRKRGNSYSGSTPSSQSSPKGRSAD